MSRIWNNLEFISNVRQRIASVMSGTSLRAAVMPYVITATAIALLVWIVPFSALAENAGIAIFVVLITCAWYCGVGPAVVSPLMLVLMMRFRELGFDGVKAITAKEVFDLTVITCFTTAVGVSGVLRRRSQAIAEKRSRQLVEQDRRKDEFLATLAHELRNPLAPIRTGLELLRLLGSKAPADLGVHDVHQMMQRQVNHMVRLIDDLLDVSRINTGKIEIRREFVPLADVIRDAIESSRPHIDAAGHTLKLSIPSQIISIDVDRARMTQVLMNLLNNAAKFTDPGGRIELDAKVDQVDGKIVEIRVRDSGIGMNSETLPRIFDMFAQEKNLLTRSHGGLGIGLSLVRSIVELHGGKVDAFSEGLGKGSEFVVRLPCAAQTSISEGANRAESPRPSGRRILIVDDNEDAAMSLAMMLSAHGHICDTAFDGPAALQTAAAFRPDVFLLDIGMPGMSGFELATKLRGQDSFKKSLLVAVTGWGQPSDRQKCLEAGFDQHLVKPVELQQLLSSLSRDGSS